MKSKIFITFTGVFLITLFTSCSNKIEEIKDPTTGKILQRFEYYVDDNGQHVKDGEYKEWDSSGKLIAEYNYAHDSLTGECISTKPDGKVFINNFSAGKMNGVQTIKNAEGKIMMKGNYKNDIQDGEQQLYTSGKLWQKQYFSNGVPVDKWIIQNSEHKFSLSFKNGICQELIGTWDDPEERATYFIFGKQGDFQLYYPYFARFGDASLQIDGSFLVDSELHLIHKNGITLEYEIYDVQKDRLLLRDRDEDTGKNNITTLIRRKM